MKSEILPKDFADDLSPFEREVSAIYTKINALIASLADDKYSFTRDIIELARAEFESVTLKDIEEISLHEQAEERFNVENVEEVIRIFPAHEEVSE